MPARVRVAAAAELAPGQGKLVVAGGQEMALLNVGGTFYATESKCPHRGGPMESAFAGGNSNCPQSGAAVVTCIWHGWEFDLATGKSSNIPGVTIRTYAVTVEGEDVYVEVDVGGGLTGPQPPRL